MADYVLTVLSRIKPEHIEEMRRVDCMEPSPLRRRLGVDDPIFVVLKPGIAFDINDGSYVVDATSPPRKR